jgi:membrane-associated phospholipid phosphatase
MLFFRNLFYNFPKNLIGVFSPRNIPWHVLAILSTFLIIISGFDWYYFNFFNGTIVQTIMFGAVLLGSFMPVILPIAFIIIGKIFKFNYIGLLGYALGQSAILGSLISSFYKAITGRSHPLLHAQTIIDTTREFSFSLFKNGVFWGWPSSHTTIAFAMSFAVISFFPQNKFIKLIALLYALYVGVGVSMSIHWFSDFTAGAIFGTIIGITVGKSFRKLV